MKKLKFSKPKKVKRSTLRNKADKLWSLRIREVGVCMLSDSDEVSCGGVLQAAHIIGRSNHALRWNLQNGLCICAGHHRYYTSHPFYWNILIENKFPNKYKYLFEHRNEIWDKDILKVIKELEI